MKLAIRKEEGVIPLSGFHYMLFPMALSTEVQAEMFKLMGYIVVEVEQDVGERLIQQAGNAIRHQVEVALICERNPRG